jgi:hypothetical protein
MDSACYWTMIKCDRYSRKIEIRSSLLETENDHTRLCHPLYDDQTPKDRFSRLSPGRYFMPSHFPIPHGSVVLLCDPCVRVFLSIDPQYSARLSHFAKTKVSMVSVSGLISYRSPVLQLVREIV